MNEPIISPWLFYWIDVFGGLSIFYGLLTIVIFLCVIPLVITYFASYDQARIHLKRQTTEWQEEKKITDKNVIDEYKSAYEWHEFSKKWIKRWIPLFLIPFFIGSFIPSKDTIYKMVIASQVTPANIEKAVKTGKDFKDEIKKDVFDLIDKFNNGDKKEEKKENK